jgi:hypothetical protein
MLHDHYITTTSEDLPCDDVLEEILAGDGPAAIGELSCPDRMAKQIRLALAGDNAARLRIAEAIEWDPAPDHPAH